MIIIIKSYVFYITEMNYYNILISSLGFLVEDMTAEL
jgi:hypothetical protein